MTTPLGAPFAGPMPLSATEVVDDRQMDELPSADSPWPPPEWDPISYMHRAWSAWWTGDRQMLAWVYWNLGANSPAGRAFYSTTGEAGLPVPRPGQYRAGLLGSIDYSFHGTPVSPGEKRTKYHVPIAGDIAQTNASLLFSSPPKLKTTLTGAAGIANQAYFDTLLDDGFLRRLNEAAEFCSALGGVYLKIMWDAEVSPMPWIQPFPADVALPEFSGDKLTAVVFWRILAEDGDKVTRHLERHHFASNTITHQVFEGTQTEIGPAVPLSNYPATAQLGSELDGNTLTLPDLPLDASTVVYIPNVTPNRIFREFGPQAWPLGRSDYSGIEPLMDALDECYSAWMREIRLAKLRLIVPQSYLDNIGKGEGAVFEPERQVFTPLNMLNNDGTSPQITANQFNIRWQEFQGTCEDLANRIVQEAGYSPQTFGDYAGGALTATEIEARERISLMTRKKKITYWRPGMQDSIYSLMTVARLHFGAHAITPERPDIEWPAVALPDELQLAQTVAALATANAASTETRVQMAHPDWDKEQVAAEVRLIISETGQELATHAKVALAGPMGATLAEDVQALASAQQVPPEDTGEPPGMQGTANSQPPDASGA